MNAMQLLRLVQESDRLGLVLRGMVQVLWVASREAAQLSVQHSRP